MKKAKKVQINSNKTAVIYTRVSSGEQVKGTSLENQDEQCVEYCKRKGLEVVATFKDEGETAKDLSLGNRENFFRALEFCRKNKVGAFVVLRVNRFARNTEDHFYVRRKLLQHGTALHSVTEPIGNKPTEKFAEVIFAAAAEYDNGIRRQQCVDGMSQKLKQGIWPWKPPVGYICAHNKKKDQKKTEPDQPHPDVFPLLQKLLKQHAKELISAKGIVDALKESDFKKWTGIEPTKQAVNHILGEQLAFYAGMLKNPWPSEDGSDKEFKGKHKAMITDGERLAIQNIRKGKGGQGGLKKCRDNSKYPLRGFVQCPSCHRPMTASTSTGEYNKFDYYHCYFDGCPLRYKSIPKAEMEKAFIALLQKIVPTQAFTAYFEAVVLGHWQSQNAELKKSTSVHDKELAELQAKRTRIFEMRESGDYTTAEFVERRDDVERQIATVQSAITESNIDDYNLEEGLEYAKQSILDLASQWFKLEMPLRKKFQKIVFPEEICFDRKTFFGTPELSSIFALNQAYLSQNYDLVPLSRLELETNSLKGNCSTN